MFVRCLLSFFYKVSSENAKNKVFIRRSFSLFFFVYVLPRFRESRDFLVAFFFFFFFLFIYLGCLCIILLRRYDFVNIVSRKITANLIAASLQRYDNSEASIFNCWCNLPCNKASEADITLHPSSAWFRQLYARFGIP